MIGPVDQSIQLGDGGTGITVELNGFYNFSHQVECVWQVFFTWLTQESRMVLLLQEVELRIATQYKILHDYYECA